MLWMWIRKKNVNGLSLSLSFLEFNLIQVPASYNHQYKSSATVLLNLA